ncbi:MAG: hypothetical protein CBD76_01300 [Pelagibacteraceae bacterium TMED216]|nr:MAG: hypothetical protein CBD76_01300 [Pelagibacteraceae bacterium TMED216]|tara:strand:+ start:8759 stop:9799 length:1041 start_codon:yes stop_codon:yes gene_type:complete
MKLNKKIFISEKKLPVDKFLDKVLYDKNYGYYSTKNPFGQRGDFITSPNISFLFNEIIAIWIITEWEKLGRPKKINLIELGPGNGMMSLTILKTIKRFSILENSINYFLFEKSSYLRKIQKKNLKGLSVKWIQSLKDLKNYPSIFFGNEFFDAIPIKQFVKKRNSIYEKFFKLDEKNNIQIIFQKTSKDKFKFINNFKSLKNKKFVELPEQGFRELKKIIKIIKKNTGGVLLIDYGFNKNFDTFSLQSVINHKRNPILKNLGKADITSLVNFKLLKEFFEKEKLNVGKIETQENFLKRYGIEQRAEIISKNMSFKSKADLYFRLKRLIGPNLMGKHFKVIYAYANI